MPIVDISNLTKRYRNGTLANDDISLTLEPGEVFGLLGPNGAGKTTLVRQVLGLLRPTSGAITVQGVDVIADPGYARENIGFLPQAQSEYDSIHVDEFIYCVGKLRGLPGRDASRRTDELVERLDLAPFRKTPFSSASGGVRRLAGFAAAIVAHSRILVLDEPTNDVDPIRRQLLWGMIDELGQEGSTVLLVTHNLAEAERIIDRLAIVSHGRVVAQGTPASMRSMVTERLRLELTLVGEVTPHAALMPDPHTPGAYLFEEGELARVSQWLISQRDEGRLVDFRIGPPSLDDIYAAAVNGRPALQEATR